MSNIQKKDKVQQSALKAWLNMGKIGTCEIITGLGKTFIALHALYTMPKDKSVEHLFLAEVTDRKKDLAKDIEKYNQIFNRNVLEDYNLKFYCYQSVFKWKNKKFGLVIADEIHDSLTPSYSKFYFNNYFQSIIGLSALVDVKTYYKDINKTKGYFLNKIAPICFRYHIDKGLEEGTARDLDIYIIHHKLDNIKKNIQAGSKTKKFYQTEANSYKYWDSQFNKLIYQKTICEPEEIESLDIRLQIAISKRSKLLYDLPSKTEIVKTLMPYIKGKNIIFSNSLDSLLKITPNVVSSRNSDKKNDLIRYQFDNNLISTIGSFKKLKQGANLKNLDCCIILSYYSKEKDLIQRLGRLRENGQIGKVFIIVTQDTKEVNWFNRMFENVNNYNFIHCKDVYDCINKIK